MSARAFQALRVLARPGQQVAQPIEGRFLAEARRTDRDAVHRFLDFRHQARSGRDTADAVAGQREHLGEAVEVHQRAAPCRIGEQIVRPLALRQKVLVGLVEDQRDAALLGEFIEGVDGRARIDGAGRVVGRDQDDRAGARADQPGRVLRVRHGARAGTEVERHGLDALHAHPHVVIEVVRPWHDHLVAGLGEAHERQAEGLIASRGDADFAGGDRRAVEVERVGA
jgi:hypothetical protein